MMKIGQGIDFHIFAEGRRMIIGGVDLALPYGLAGHSDADVLLHALSDAILGALGRGDIGEHFPDSSEQYRDADSAMLLDEVLRLMQADGYHLVNCDLTLIGEKPRITPHKQAIRNRLKDLLGIEHINIKATTTEKMGAIGKGEGLCAMAIVLISDGTL